MRPKDGDIVLMTFGKDRSYYGVIQIRAGMSERCFEAYSLEAEQHKMGHGGQSMGGKGRWFTVYDEYTDKMDSHVTLMIPPRRKTTPLDGMANPRAGLRVTLSVLGRLVFNVCPEHGGPYGTGDILEVKWTSHRSDRQIVGYSVRWKTGPMGLYSPDTLDVIVPDVVQRNLWEEICQKH